MQVEHSSLGRVLYAIAVIGMGVICLVYLDFVNSLQPVPASTPGYRPLWLA